jgi:hypothetical protein
MNGKVPAGTWVEIERTLLTPEQRAPQVPEDTKKTPYVVRISGFLTEPAELGQTARIRSLIGRIHSGQLREVGPRYAHSFGNAVPELLNILPAGEDA